LTTKTSEERTSTGRAIPSCKLLTRLAESPAADITQIPAATTSGSDEESHQEAGVSPGEGSVKCRKAYEMLIQYATTESKMDAVAQVLENSCTKNGKGGCGVRSEVILQALDKICGLSSFLRRGSWI
jgi:hypothetical protein